MTEEQKFIFDLKGCLSGHHAWLQKQVYPRHH